MGEVRSRRVFFALWPDREAVGQLSALGRNLAGTGGRLTHPAMLHLTLVFVGSVTPIQVEQLQGIAAGVRAGPFELSLDRLGFWPQRGILWAGCSLPPEPLRRLAESLAAVLRAAGWVIDNRSGSALVPHITLARRARCAALPQLAAPILWRVSEFTLVESQLHPSGARYETLASFPLNEVDAG